VLLRSTDDFLSGFSISDSSPFEEWTILKREQINQRVMGILAAWQLITNTRVSMK
jgi:hypothetical protein